MLFRFHEIFFYESKEFAFIWIIDIRKSWKLAQVHRFQSPYPAVFSWNRSYSSASHSRATFSRCARKFFFFKFLTYLENLRCCITIDWWVFAFCVLYSRTSLNSANNYLVWRKYQIILRLFGNLMINWNVKHAVNQPLSSKAERILHRLLQFTFHEFRKRLQQLLNTISKICFKHFSRNSGGSSIP